ncbi:MAG: hypothetical protein JWO67_4003 [Streptosporangiaceae bacterium]|nr:hypothetical protein [Streptosporangiaceae bacterium]
MGISFAPGGAQWDYLGYHMFRKRLAALDGIDLDRMAGFAKDETRDWEDYLTPLEPLINSSDVRGFIGSWMCEQMLPKLRAVAAQWTAAGPANHNEEYDLSSLGALIAGMEHCAEHGCALQYG